MKKVIVKSGLTSHQRFMLIILCAFFFIVGKSEIIERTLFPIMKLHIGNYIVVFLHVVSLGILGLLLSKEGIIIDSHKLFNSKFIFGKPYFMTEIKLLNMTDICISNYEMSQKLAFITAAKPDLSETIRVSKIYLLNENHSQKRLVISTFKKEHAELIMKEIQNEFGFKFNHYNPPTRRQRLLKAGSAGRHVVI